MQHLEVAVWMIFFQKREKKIKSFSL
ncbi:hypothetical protein M2326_003532, partial [Flavobacterium sp. 7A]|nr:hypothetical protein [Flavobacterium sp. 7A]